MANVQTILSRLAQAAINADNPAELGAELRSYMLENADEIEELFAAVDGWAYMPGALHCFRDAELPARIASVLADVKTRQGMAKRSASLRACDLAASRISASVERDGERFYLDAGALLDCAKAIPGRAALRLDIHGAEIHIGAHRLKELGKVKKGVALVAYVEAIETLGAGGFFVKGWAQNSQSFGYTLVVTWQNASGTRGQLRFRDDASHGAVHAAATVWAAQDVVAA